LIDSLFYDVSYYKPAFVPVRVNAPITQTTIPLTTIEVKVPSTVDVSDTESDTASIDHSEMVETTDSDDNRSTVSLSLSSSAEYKPTSDIFHPDRMASFAFSPSGNASDSLLWIAYIMINGHEKFETIDNHYTESNTFKFALVELIRQNKSILKANKIKVNCVEENLVHKPFIQLETMQAIVLCKNISVCIVQDRKYYEIQNGTGAGASMGTGVVNNIGFIIEKIKGKYVLYTCPDSMRTEYLKYIRANYWLMESISTPIRPMSAYKLQDLIDISVKLGLPIASIIPGKFGSIGTEKRKTKPELYEAICKCV
jgi:hypothetical protein